MRKAFIVLASLAGVAAALPAPAQQNDRPGIDSPGQVRPPDKAIGLPIADRDRDAVYNYYHVGHTEGPAPSDHARKIWAIGRPLPDDVIYHPLPAVLLGQLTLPPAGYEYVRVGNDVLLMAMGTRIIAGAVADLSGF